MAGKKEKKIINKIRILLTQHFENPEDAFKFFDKNQDGSLSKNEVKALLKQAEIGGFLRGIVAGKLMEKFDESDDDKIIWSEFKSAVKDIVSIKKSSSDGDQDTTT